MCLWFAGLRSYFNINFFLILSTTQGYSEYLVKPWASKMLILHYIYAIESVWAPIVSLCGEIKERKRGELVAARRLRCTSARCSGAARGGGVLAAAEQHSTYYEDMLMTWENVLKSYTATLYFILILLKLHFLPATCLSAHLMYSSCCFNKLTAAGSTANPAWFMGPALPFDPVPVGPLFPLKVVWLPSFLKAPVGHTLAQ